MISALRTMPEDFEIREGWLHHVPSQHSFMFDREGQVRIRAECNCSHLAVKHEQSRELFGSYNEWQTSYWQPLLINREFASHFRRSRARSMAIAFVAWLHRRLLLQRHRDYRPSQVSAMSPAE
jgi:hypothetical protein